MKSIKARWTHEEFLRCVIAPNIIERARVVATSEEHYLNYLKLARSSMSNRMTKYQAKYSIYAYASALSYSILDAEITHVHNLQQAKKDLASILE